MKKQFDLMLRNRRKSQWFGFCFFPAWLAMCMIFFKLSKFLPVGIRDLTAMILALPGAYGLFKLYQILSHDSALVTIEEDKLSVLYRKSGREFQLNLADVVAQQSGYFKGGASLTLECKDVITVLSSEYRTTSFMEMATQFNEAFYRYKFGRDKPVPIYEGPAFFRSPIAGFILIGLVISAVALTVFLPDFSDTRALILGGCYIGVTIYYAVWTSANEQKPQKR